MADPDKKARQARARELLAKRQRQTSDRIEKRLTEEATEESARKAHEMRTGDRDRVTRDTKGISPDAAAAFKKAVGVTPDEFRAALLYDRNRTRGSKNVAAFNAVVRRLKAGQIDKAEALLKTHTDRFKDSAREGAATAKEFEKKYGKRPRGGSSQSSSGGSDRGSAIRWWLSGGR